MINPFYQCRSFSTIVLIRLFTKDKKSFFEIINNILRQFLAKHFGAQLLHLQTFSDRYCHNVFSKKLTIYFGLIVNEDCIMKYACISSNIYWVHVLMEQFISIVADIEVVDKKETKGVSTEKDQDD